MRRGTRVAGLAGLAGVLLLAGCKIGPDYHRPAVVVPKAYLYEPAQAATTANVDWWTQFNDPVLNQLIADGLANNKSIKIAAANVEQAGAALTSARSPSVAQLNYQSGCGPIQVRGKQRPSRAEQSLESDPTNFYRGYWPAPAGDRSLGAHPTAPPKLLKRICSRPRKSPRRHLESEGLGGERDYPNKQRPRRAALQWQSGLSKATVSLHFVDKTSGLQHGRQSPK